MVKVYASIAAVLALSVGSFWFGMSYAQGQQAKEEALVKKVQEAASKSAAEAIAKIEVKNITIRQELEREIRENVIYRECRHDAVGLQLLNDALRGPSAGGSKLPGLGRIE